MSLHSSFGASACHRWLRCPASIKASEGLPNVSSPAAEEGTMLHEVAANTLTDLPIYVELTDEQQQIVDIYVNTVREEAAGDAQLFVEVKFHIPVHDGFWGTADAVVVRDKKLTVLDLKCGRGVAVEADYNGRVNPQLGFYALGAMAALKRYDFEEIEVVIVQPRFGGVKRRTTNVLELKDLQNELLAAAAEAESDNPPYQAGSHCKFCLARHTCKELEQEAKRIARMEFADAPPEIETLTQRDLAEILNDADVIETWIKAVKDHAFSVLHEGNVIEGWGLSKKKKQRQWADVRLVKQRLASEGLDNFIIEKLASPAQVEKLAKKQGISLDLTDLLEETEYSLSLSRNAKGHASAHDLSASEFADGV